MQGPCYLQFGTWDTSETTFTPTGGLWVLPWHGVMKTDYSVQISIAGCGSGGTIDGWWLEMTLTRAAAKDSIDPTVPYLYSATIKPPPMNTVEVVDDFDDTEPPLTAGAGIALSAWQYTDGNQPELAVTYDNLELRTSEIPPVRVERAVRLSWPTSSINSSVEAAPTPRGPWLPVLDPAKPGMQQMTVLADSAAQFYRLIQAP